jgi:hypothetical protein
MVANFFSDLWSKGHLSQNDSEGLMHLIAVAWKTTQD